MPRNAHIIIFCLAALLMPGFRPGAHASAGGKSVSAPPRGQLPWQMQTLDTRGQVGASSDLAIDARDRPHLLYTVGDIEPGLRYGYYDGVRWRFETLPFPVTVNENGEVPLALALDTASVAHGAFTDGLSGGIRYAVRTATGWEVQNVAPESDAGYVDLEIAGDGTPVVSWYDHDAQAVRVSRRAAGAWHHETVAPAGDVGGTVSLSLDSPGVPSVSYYDSGTGAIIYAERGASGWQLTSVASAGPAGGYPSLARDSAGNLHLAYVFGDGAVRQVRYTRRVGTGWSAPETVGNNGSAPSLAIAPGGAAHVSYHTAGSNYLYHADSLGGAWSVETVDSASDPGMNSSLAVDSGGRPHITYYHLDYADLRYAAALPVWQSATVDDLVNSNSWFSMAEDSGGNPHFIYNDGGTVTLSAWNGAAWAGAPLPGVVGEAHFASLQYNGEGDPRVVYYDRTRDVLALAEWGDGSWSHSVIEQQQNAGHYPTLMIARDGTPIVAYWDDTNHRVKVAARVGGQWRIGAHTTGPLLNGESGRPAAALGADGAVWVSYYDAPRTDLRVAAARYAGGAWTWQDALVGQTEGHTGSAHHIAMTVGQIPVIAYAYRDVNGNHALRYGRYNRAAGSWSATQFRPLPGIDGVRAISLATRVGNISQPRVAYIVDEGATDALWLASNNGNTWRFDSFGAVSGGGSGVRPQLAAWYQDRLAYLDGARLDLLTRATTEEHASVPAVEGAGVGDNDEIFGWCLCLLASCFDWQVPGSSASGSRPADGNAVLLQLIPLFNQTSEGRHYIDEYREHGADLYTLLITHPHLTWDAYRTLQEFLPGLEALVTGRGDAVIVTPKMVAHAYGVWEFVLLLGEPGLSQAVSAELVKSNNLQDYVGMTFNEWATAIGVPPPTGGRALFLPVIRN